MKGAQLTINDGYTAIELLRREGHLEQMWNGPSLLYRLREK
jgi:hypothetical protein